MTIPREVRTKFYGLRSLALILMIFGAALFLLRPHDFSFRSLAIVAVLVGAWVGRQANLSASRAKGLVMPNSSFEGSFAKQLDRTSPWVWILTGLSLAACVVCYYLMYLDQLNGGKEVWPVWAFFVAAIALTLSSSYAVMKIYNRWSR